MGRRKKYFSEEEKRLANKNKVFKYYWNNKEACDKKARERYWRKKLGTFPESPNEINNDTEGKKEVIRHPLKPEMELRDDDILPFDYQERLQDKQKENINEQQQ